MKRFANPLSKIVISLIVPFGLATVASAILLVSPPASACRDCPFPLKVSDHQWLMPKSEIMIMIDEQPISKILTKMTIELIDSNGNVLAHGSVIHGRNQRDVEFVLRDRKGHKVNGTIALVNFKEDVIQASFDCESEDDDVCATSRSY